MIAATVRRSAVALLVICIATYGYLERSERFEFVEGGYAVLDHHTGLVWQRCADGMGTKWPSTQEDGCFGEANISTWGAALDFAQARAKSSGKAWRLPTVHELNSIVDDEQAYPALNPKFFPFFSDYRPPTGMRGNRFQYFWTINTYANDPISGSAWIVDLSEGRILNQEISRKAYSRLVRPK